MALTGPEGLAIGGDGAVDPLRGDMAGDGQAQALPAGEPRGLGELARTNT